MPFSKPPPRRWVRPVAPLYNYMKFLLRVVKGSTGAPENGKQKIVDRIMNCMSAASDDMFRERYDQTQGEVEQWLDANVGISWRQKLQNVVSRAQKIQAQQPNVGNCLRCGTPLPIDPLNQHELKCLGCGWVHPRIRETKTPGQNVKAKPRSLRQPTPAAQPRESKSLSDHVALLNKAILDLRNFTAAPNYNRAVHDRAVRPLISGLAKAAKGSLADNSLQGMELLHMAGSLLAGTSKSTGIQID